MKPIISTIALSLCMLFPSVNINENVSDKLDTVDYPTNTSEINTKYSEFPSAVFKNKLIITSSKKIGGLGNGKDKLTNEPYFELFCLDISGSGELSNPLFFSRTLNTKHNEGMVSFSPKDKTIYFSRSLRDNSKNYQLYKANLNVFSKEIWINQKRLSKNANHSIENPRVSPDGKKLYFSSNLPGSIGGYDLYVSDILSDGTIGTPKNLGDTINTALDDKYPFLSEDGTQLYFSSQGHNSIGGFDIFVSQIKDGSYQTPIHLEENINTPYDEVAFILINNNGQGYFSSNKPGGKGSFDIYSFYLKSQFNLEDVFANKNDKK